MKRLVFLTAAGAMLLAAATTHAQNSVSSKVVEARVFLRGAELTQTATASLAKGAGEVTIEGLAANVDYNSVKVNIGGGVVVSSFEYSSNHLADSKPLSPRLKMLRDSVEFYKTALDRLYIDIEVNESMGEYLSDGVDKNVSGSDAGLGIDELKKTMDYYKSKSEEIFNRALDLKKQSEKTSANLSRVQRQFNEEAGTTNKTSGVLLLAVSAPAAGNYPVTVTYYTYSAGWSPYYDVDAPSTDKPVKFSARAKVSQWTGLDWTNVRLTLSTTAPTGGKSAPLFSTWFLRQERPKVVLRGAASVNSLSYEMADVQEMVVDEEVYLPEIAAGAPAAKPAPTMYDYVAAEDNALSVTYDIDLPYSIPGNGKARNIDLSTIETPAEFKYYAAPKLDAATYLVAEIADWQKLGLLSATAGITYDGTYIGQTNIDASSTEDKLVLTLGTDKRVTVTRELVRDFSTTKAVGGNTEQTFAYKLTVRNGQKSPVFVVLKDQYPVSTDKSIVVTLGQTTPAPTANVTDTGVVTWEQTVAAGRSLDFTISYTVRRPKNMRLNL